MTVELDDELRITVTLTMPGTTVAQNVFYTIYKGVSQAWDYEVVQDMSDMIVAIFDTIKSDLGTGVSISSVETYKRESGTPDYWGSIGVDFPTWAGTGISEVLPNGVALVIRSLTGAVKTVGRKYVAGLTENEVSTTTWVAGALARAALFLIQWYVGWAASPRDYQSGVWSTLTSAIVPMAMEGVVSTIPGYQRRRKPGVGM